jgi:hypothetical protein
MARILIGLAAAIVVAAGGYFGFEFYVQHRVAGEVEAAFDQIRASGGKASHGKISFDPWSRTLGIADIAAESASQPPVSVKIASVTAVGVGQPGAARFSADSIEATDIEVHGGIYAQAGMDVSYKLPRITVKDYAGPTGLARLPPLTSVIDLYRFGLEQFAGVTASSITAPSLAATMSFSAATPGGGDVAYSGLAMEGIKDGKVATMKVDGFIFTVTTQQAGKAEKMTGNLANLAAYDFDATAAAAILDPQKASDDRAYRIYRQASAGPYTITAEHGVRMRIDALAVDDIGARPSRLQLPALLAMLPPPGSAPTPAQTRDMLEKAAKIYEGIRIGNAELRGLSMDTPEGGFKLSAIRFNMENGKASEFAFEGFDGRTPKGPVKVARFALKAFDIANLLRMSALFSNPEQKPSPDQAIGLIALLEGIEVKGVVAPFKNTGKPFNIDTFSLDWGQFVGPIPSKARLTVKMSAPFDASDPRQKMLVTAGLDTAVMDLDLGAAWADASRTFALEPVSLELGGVLKASVRVSLANVPRAVFSSNLAQGTAAAAQIEAGTLEFVLHDTGGVDFTVAQQAREQNISREAARRAIVDGFRASGENAAAANPDAMAAAEALARFVETPGQTLNIKLTPLGKVPALQLIQLLKTDPLIALAQFRIEASTGL